MRFLNNVFRRNFVSHSDKFLEQHGHFCAKYLNHLDDLNFQEFKSGIKSTINEFPSKSPLHFINNSFINTPELFKSLTILFVLQHHLKLEGITIDELTENLSIKINQSLNREIELSEIISSIDELSAEYKNLSFDKALLSNINCIYDDFHDVETPEHLDGLFNAFYTIQGYFICVSNYSIDPNLTNFSNIEKSNFSQKLFNEVIKFKNQSAVYNSEIIIQLIQELYRVEYSLN
ncbi:MAG: hypothetical protein RLZZ198_944 [Bacteroidota bacterium]|jgi:hypothetical protein